MGGFLLRLNGQCNSAGCGFVFMDQAGEMSSRTTRSRVSGLAGDTETNGPGTSASRLDGGPGLKPRSRVSTGFSTPEVEGFHRVSTDPSEVEGWVLSHSGMVLRSRSGGLKRLLQKPEARLHVVGWQDVIHNIVCVWRLTGGLCNSL